MTRLTPSVHVVVGGDTLQKIADRFGLPSADVVRASPRNASLEKLAADARIPVGSVVYVPPHPASALGVQFGEVNLLNALLRSLFELHEQTLASSLALLETEPRMHQAGEILQKLDALVDGQIETLERSCGVLNQANDALSEMGLLEDGDSSGAVWLLSADVFDLWQTMWLPANWTERFASGEGSRAELFAFVKMVKSRVIQHGEKRARESVLQMQRLQVRRS